MPAALESTCEQISSREMPKALDIKKKQSANHQFNTRAIILRFDQQCHVPLSSDYWRGGINQHFL